MTDLASRRLALAALLVSPVAMAGCARAQEEEEVVTPCPELVGHLARFIGPDDAVTMDYNPDRVNIFHDGSFVITQITWG